MTFTNNSAMPRFSIGSNPPYKQDFFIADVFLKHKRRFYSFTAVGFAVENNSLENVFVSSSVSQKISAIF